MTAIWTHRGASVYALENIISVTQQAIEMDADGVEFDVQRTIDGQLVTIHDETINRTSNGFSRAADLTLKQSRLCNYNSGFIGYRKMQISTLREVLELLEPTRLHINLELENSIELYPGMENDALAIVQDTGMLHRVLFSSFNHFFLVNLCGTVPSECPDLLYSDGLYDPWCYVDVFRVRFFHPYFYALQQPNYMWLCHEVRMGVNVWTVDRNEDIRSLAALGVDAVITNFPDRAYRTLKRPYPRGAQGVDMTNPFRPERWDKIPGFEFIDVTYHRARDVAAIRIVFNRPRVRNAFRPYTVNELIAILEYAHTSTDTGCVLLIGNGPSPKDGGWALCSGGDQRIRGRVGYQYADGETANIVDKAKLVRLHILETQWLIRFMSRVVIALINGWVAGGGHSLHVVPSLTIVSREHARSKQADADVGSFNGGFGSTYLAHQVGQKFTRQTSFLGDVHDVQEAHEVDMVSEVVPHEELEETELEWTMRICGKSPTAQQILKYSLNLVDDGLVGQQVLLGEAIRLAYMTDEAVEGRDSLLECRTPDRSGFPYYY